MEPDRFTETGHPIERRPLTPKQQTTPRTIPIRHTTVAIILAFLPIIGWVASAMSLSYVFQ